MYRKFIKVLGLASLVSFFAAPAALAGGTVSVFGAGVIPQTIELGAASSITGKLGFGGGLLGEWRLKPWIGIETGGVFLARKTSATLAGIEFGESTHKGVYIPVGFRLHPNRVISLQAGGFYDLSLESGEGANYGVQGGLRLSLPLSGGTAFFAEGRYNLGLQDYVGFKHSDIALVMVGLTFGGVIR